MPICVASSHSELVVRCRRSVWSLCMLRDGQAPILHGDARAGAPIRPGGGDRARATSRPSRADCQLRTWRRQEWHLPRFEVRLVRYSGPLLSSLLHGRTIAPAQLSTTRSGTKSMRCWGRVWQFAYRFNCRLRGRRCGGNWTFRLLIGSRNHVITNHIYG